MAIYYVIRNKIRIQEFLLQTEILTSVRKLILSD